MSTQYKIEAQLTMIQSKDSSIHDRVHAIWTLRALNASSPGVTNTLISVAKDVNDHKSIRKTAIRVLGELKDPAAFEPLAYIMKKDNFVSLRHAAIEALGLAGNCKAADALIYAMKNEKGSFEKAAAAQALGKLPPAAKITKALITAIGIEDEALQKAAMNGLGALKNPLAVDPVVVLLKSPLVSHKLAAAEALGQIGSAKAVHALIAAANDSNESMEVRSAAVDTLGKLPPTAQATDALLAIVNTLDSEAKAENESEKIPLPERALSALGKLGTKRAISGILSSLGSSYGVTAKEILVGIGKPAVPLLVQTLTNGNEQARRAAVQALGIIGDEKATWSLISLLGNEKEDSWFRAEQVLPALLDISHSEAIPALIKAASRQIDDILTLNSIQALGDLRAHQAVDLLISLVQDETPNQLPHVVINSCWALGKINDAKAVTPLLKILSTRNGV